MHIKYPKRLAIAVVLLLLICEMSRAQSIDEKYIKQLYDATALLYVQGETGTMAMRCTATAIAKNDTGYTFVTAAHCACNDDDDKKTTSPEKTNFFITSDSVDKKNFLSAKPIGCGYQHRGDDFALFSVETKDDFPVIPIGDNPKLLDQVVNVASPIGLGKQVFVGSVSSQALERPAITGDINWERAVLVQLFGVNGGSSGSSLICVNQKAICGFVVGSIRDTTIVAMPVDRFKKFREQLGNGTYTWWNPDPDSNATKPAAKKN